MRFLSEDEMYLLNHIMAETLFAPETAGMSEKNCRYKDKCTVSIQGIDCFVNLLINRNKLC